MAFNWQTFRTRTLTAAVFAAVMLIGLLWNPWSFFILFSIIHFGCWWEYFNLLEKIHQTTYHRYIKLGFMLTGFAVVLWLCNPTLTINDYSLKNNFSLPVSIAGIIFLLLGIFQTKRVNLRAFGAAAIGWFYISLSWGLMMNLTTVINLHVNDTMFVIRENFIPLVIVASIWINDTMAYIVGSLIGKTPLSKISPKKTWEGTIGGILLSVVLIGALFTKAFFSVSSLNLNIYVGLIAFICAIFGTLGDLLESKLKRMANVKDSGHIMPGHGGFLDRFDSMLLAIPAVWLFIYFFLR